MQSELEGVPDPDIGDYNDYCNVELLLHYLSVCDSRLEDIQEEKNVEV